MHANRCRQVLGVEAGASLAEVRRAYVTLAAELRGGAADSVERRERYRQLTEAYSTLAEAHRAGGDATAGARCPRCGGGLAGPVEGGRPGVCAKCLLGWRRRLLPMPIYVKVRCVLCIVLQAGALWGLIAAWTNESVAYALVAISLGLSSTAALTYHVLTADVIERK